MKDFSDISKMCQILSSFCWPHNFQIEHGIRIQFNLKNITRKALFSIECKIGIIRDICTKGSFPPVYSGSGVKEKGRSAQLRHGHLFRSQAVATAVAWCADTAHVHFPGGPAARGCPGRLHCLDAPNACWAHGQHVLLLCDSFILHVCVSLHTSHKSFCPWKLRLRRKGDKG